MLKRIKKFFSEIKELKKQVEFQRVRINCLEGSHVWEVPQPSFMENMSSYLLYGNSHMLNKVAPKVLCRHCQITPPAPVEAKKKRARK